MTNMIAQVNTLFEEISAKLKTEYPVLKGWDIKWNSRLRTVMGRAYRTNDGSKEIQLSTHLVHINKNSPNFLNRIKETILHEWAHALDWELSKGWGHGPTWKSWMRKLGIPVERCYDSSKWLCVPNKARWAIRNAASGKIYFYVTNVTPSIMIDAYAKNQRDGGQLDDIVLINLETGEPYAPSKCKS